MNIAVRPGRGCRKTKELEHPAHLDFLGGIEAELGTPDSLEITDITGFHTNIELGSEDFVQCNPML